MASKALTSRQAEDRLKKLRVEIEVHEKKYYADKKMTSMN